MRVVWKCLKRLRVGEIQILQRYCWLLTEHVQRRTTHLDDVRCASCERITRRVKRARNCNRRRSAGGGEAHIARTQGEAIGVAHRWHTTDADRWRRGAPRTHPLHDAQLLRILFTKIGSIGHHEIKES